MPRLEFEALRSVDSAVAGDFVSLIQFLAEFSMSMLEREGGFHPHGACIVRSGELEIAAPWPSREEVLAAELVNTLVNGFRERAREGTLRAAGIAGMMAVSDPRDGGETDAIAMLVEHVEADPLNVYLPYRRRLLRKPRFGEPFSSPGEARIFSEPTT